MKKSILAALLVSATVLSAPAAQLAAADNASLATFIDGPTGYKFVWRRDSGWEFVGRSEDGGVEPASLAGKAAWASPGKELQEGAPLAEFVDGPTGFRFVWLHGSGWKFAGVSPVVRGASKQASTGARDIR